MVKGKIFALQIFNFGPSPLQFLDPPLRGVLEGGRGGGATGLLNKGGESNRLPGLVTKQQAVEFPQVQTSDL